MFTGTALLLVTLAFGLPPSYDAATISWSFDAVEEKAAPAPKPALPCEACRGAGWLIRLRDNAAVTCPWCQGSKYQTPRQQDVTPPQFRYEPQRMPLPRGWSAGAMDCPAGIK